MTIFSADPSVLPPKFRQLFPEHIDSGVAVLPSIRTEGQADRFVSDIAGWLRALQQDETRIAEEFSFEPMHQVWHPIDEAGSTPGVRRDSSSNQILSLVMLHPASWGAAKYMYLTGGTRSARRFGTIKLSSLDDMWSGLHRSLSRWAFLPADWDGEDGTAPPSKSVQNAGDFLGKLQRLNIEAPEGFVAGDGEIGFRWRSNSAFASAAFLPDGHLVATARVRKKPVVKIDAPYTKAMDLSAFFKALSKIA